MNGNTIRMKRLSLVSLLMILILTVFTGCAKKAPQPTENANEPVAMEKDEGDKMVGGELSDGTYNLKVSESVLKWEASRLAATPHTGTVALKEGYIMREEGDFTQGWFVIDMSQISEDKNNDRFLGHIKNKDFFDVDSFPTSTLKITSIEESEGGYNVGGSLTILDKTNDISFPATMSHTADGLNVKATFEIDRTLWGITYDSGSIFKQIGDKAIKDEIKYDLDLLFETP